MRIGVPKEIKTRELRVALTPAGAAELTSAGHEVLVETCAGEGAGMTDEQYRRAGAQIASDGAEVFEGASLIVKVKEPQLSECALLREGQTLFTYLHLAADPAQASALLQSGATAIAYETVTASDGSLPLLAPMSEVAGRLSVQAGAYFLQSAHGGKGTLLGGVPGVAPGRVVVLGGGVAGSNAARVALGLGAEVTVLDRSLSQLRALDQRWQGRVRTAFADRKTVYEHCLKADLIVGAVLIAGAAAPRLLTRSQIEKLEQGTVLVDVSIDQGGCFETSAPTTHEQPTFNVSSIVHYCVTNMPGAVPITSTIALCNATLPYVKRLADQGVAEATLADPHLQRGLNIQRGEIIHPSVAAALGYKANPTTTGVPSH